MPSQLPRAKWDTFTWCVQPLALNIKMIIIIKRKSRKSSHLRGWNREMFLKNVLENIFNMNCICFVWKVTKEKTQVQYKYLKYECQDRAWVNVHTSYKLHIPPLLTIVT